ncbi:MAG: hypothetical protein HY901_33870 [Deltaproteobacteria bacterium]|nr:hypothetical protein [Deltaproteobacteria bacterium]
MKPVSSGVLLLAALAACPGAGDDSARDARTLAWDVAGSSDASGEGDGDSGTLAAADGGMRADVGDPDDVGMDVAGADAGSDSSRIWVYVMAGQSNMVGLGKSADLTVAQAAPVANAVIYYDSCVHPNTHTKRWLPLGPGFGALDDRFGPELGFGRRWRELYPDRALAIIKVAEGGTALHDRWKARTGDLYQLLLSEAQAQLADLSARGRPQLAGFLWMQGESDAVEAAAADLYGQNLTELVSDLRSELGVPFLPTVAGLIAQSPLWPYSGTVRNGIALVSVQLGQMEVVETSDLTTWLDDAAHYDSASTLALGRRFADAAAGMLATRWTFPGSFSPAQGDSSWLYADRDGAQQSLLTFDVAQQQWSGGAPGLVIGDGWMHPGATHQAELEWWAPFAGTLAVTLRADAADPRGDGTAVEVASASGLVWGPQGIAAGNPASHGFSVEVKQGDVLYFRTSSGPAQNPLYDATHWQIELTMSGNEL